MTRRITGDNFKTRNLRPTSISRRYPSAISPSGQEAAIRRFHSSPGFDTLFGELDHVLKEETDE